MKREHHDPARERDDVATLVRLGGKRRGRCVDRDLPQLVDVLHVRRIDLQRHLVDSGALQLQIDSEDSGTRRTAAKLEDATVLPAQRDDRLAHGQR